VAPTAASPRPDLSHGAKRCSGLGAVSLGERLHGRDQFGVLTYTDAYRTTRQNDIASIVPSSAERHIGHVMRLAVRPDQYHRLHPLNVPISHASSARVRRASQAAGKVARRQPGARCFA
jgi:hypothetical protein